MLLNIYLPKLNTSSYLSLSLSSFKSKSFNQSLSNINGSEFTYQCKCVQLVGMQVFLHMNKQNLTFIIR